MLRKEIAELFSLCMKVTTETSAFVLFRMSSRTKACHIDIADKGYDHRVGTDSSYSIYFDNKLLWEKSRKEYEAAREHLTRLLKENGS